MAKSQETFSKKEKEKLKLKRRKEKEEKKAERKANAVKGGDLEDMMAYVDENGNLTTTPPDPKKKRVNNVEDMVIGVQRQVAEAVEIQRKGIVSFFNESKGYGFIKDLKNQESVFVHINGLVEKIKEGGLEGPFKLGAIKANQLKTVLAGFLKSLNLSAFTLTNMLSYAFLVPIIPMIYDAVSEGIWDMRDTEMLVKSLSAFGLITISGNFLKRLMDLIVDRITK